MQIDIKTILRNIGASEKLDVIFTPEEINLSFQDFEFNNPIEFEGEVINISRDRVSLRGNAKTKAQTFCGRCLNKVEILIHVEINVIFKSSYQPYGEAIDENDEDYTFKGFSIEITKPISDYIILALPTRTICDDNCKEI